MTVIETIDVVMGAKTADLDKAIAKEVKALRQLERESNATSSRISVGGGGLLGGDITRTLAQYAGAAAVFQGLKTSLSLASTAESNKISLEVLSGSVEKASRLYQGFIELDRSSPLSRADFSRSAQTLIGYGFAADSTLPALKQLSEISVGNADRFQSLSLAFGQVSAQGRLMGQEVLQMVNAGFNPLQEISRTTGRSMIELKKAMEAGAISASMVEDALQSATAEGGRFYQMNERLRNSAAGQFAKMQSDVQLLATEIGTNLLPSAKAFFDLVNVGSDGNGGQGFLAQSASAFSTGIASINALFKTSEESFKLAEADAKRVMDISVQSEIQQRNSSDFYKKQTEQINKLLAERARKERDDLAAKQAQEAKITEELKKQADELKKQNEELDKQYNVKRDFLGSVEEDVARLRASNEAGLRGEQFDSKAFEEKQKLEKLGKTGFDLQLDRYQRIRREEQAIADMIKKSADLKEEFKDGDQRLVDEIRKLEELKRAGLIDQTIFDKAAKEAESATAPTDQRQGAVSVQQGSVAAYKLLLDRDNEATKIAKSQERIAQATLDVLFETRDKIGNLQPVKKAR
jgi:tape measure domain-containing protein